MIFVVQLLDAGAQVVGKGDADERDAYELSL
jgi:hypothetical protein